MGGGAGNIGTEELLVSHTVPAFSITIADPAVAGPITTEATDVSLAGTTEGSVASVSWLTDHGAQGPCVGTESWSVAEGASGFCNGTTSWTADAIPLVMAENVITITASDAAGQSGTAEVLVTRTELEGDMDDETGDAPAPSDDHEAGGGEDEAPGSEPDDPAPSTNGDASDEINAGAALPENQDGDVPDSGAAEPSNAEPPRRTDGLCGSFGLISLMLLVCGLHLLRRDRGRRRPTGPK